MTPGCKIVHDNGKALLVAVEMALAEGDPAAAVEKVEEEEDKHLYHTQGWSNGS